MTKLNEEKPYTNYKVLLRIAMKLHNPQVVAAYKMNLSIDPDPLDPVLAKYLKIYPADSMMHVLMKCILFYMIEGRLWVQSSNLTYWAQKSQSFKPQLVIQYRPVGKRKKFGYNSYAGNPQFTIPHYDGTDAPLIPTFTMGKCTAKYILSDQSYLMVHASTPQEAIDVVARMASYTLESMRPTGSILDNISISNRTKEPRMNGVQIEPYKGEYFTGRDYGDKGSRALVRLQF